MEGTLYSIIYLVVFFIGFISILVSIYSFFRMLADVKDDKQLAANVMAPIVPFLPFFFTESGNKYRARFIFFLVIGSLCIGSIYLLEVSYGKPPYMTEVN